MQVLHPLTFPSTPALFLPAFPSPIQRNKTPAQVSLNWVISKGAIPIPGCRNARHAADNAGAMGWRLTDSEVGELEAASDRCDLEFSSGGFKLE